MEEDTIVAALLHDVAEDCGVKPEELPVSTEIQEAVRLVSFQKKFGETKTAAKKRYYEAIGSNRLATAVKVLDRCNNISTMSTAFSKDKMAEYIDEIENHVMPLLDVMKHSYPEFYNAAFLLKYQMRSVLESLIENIYAELKTIAGYVILHSTDFVHKAGATTNEVTYMGKNEHIWGSA